MRRIGTISGNGFILQLESVVFAQKCSFGDAPGIQLWLAGCSSLPLIEFTSEAERDKSFETMKAAIVASNKE